MLSNDADIDPSAELLESVLNEDVPFENLRFEGDVPEVDEIEEFCKFYSKHVDKSGSKSEEIVKFIDNQIFEVICVIAWDSVST